MEFSFFSFLSLPQPVTPNIVIKHNKLRKDKNLWSNNEEGSKIKYVTLDNEKEESTYVASHIKESTIGLHDLDEAVHDVAKHDNYHKVKVYKEDSLMRLYNG